MRATRVPAHRNGSPQPVPAGQHSPRYELRPLPEEFFGLVSLAAACPEAALMCAVLEDAFLCFQKQFEIKNPYVQRAADEAEN